MRVEANGERAERRLQHLGNGAEGRPLQITRERDHLARGDARVLGVAPVERAPHATHHGGDLLADGELAARALGDDAGSLDAQHSRERDTGREALTGLQLGSVQPERLHLDEHPTSPRRRDRELADRQCIRWTWRVEDDRSHGVRHPTGLHLHPCS